MFNNYTLLDILNKAGTKSGNIVQIANLLTQDNPILQHLPWLPANDTLHFTFGKRVSLPKGAFRDFNEGVPNEASHTTRVSEKIAMLESYSEVDKALVDAAGDVNAQMEFRTMEAAAFIEGMSQTLAYEVIYGNINQSPVPKHINGLATRLATLELPNVYDNGGTATTGDKTNLTSIYIVQPGPDKAFLFHPKSHLTKGIEHDDLGQVTLNDKNGNKFEGYRDHFKVHFGFGIRDDRSVARIANIRTDIKTGAGVIDTNILIQALNNMRSNAKGARIYVHRHILTQMQIQLKEKGNVYYTADGGNGLSGERIIKFDGIPVFPLDVMSDNEAKIA